MFFRIGALQLISCLTFFGLTRAKLLEIHDDKFHYFGYGSNMLEKRIHIQNPSARRLGPALLQNYRLDFNECGNRWNGAPATIVPTEGDQVYGALWELDVSNLQDIDDQEGVTLGLYEPLSLVVIPLEGGSHKNGTQQIIARSYALVKQPSTPLKKYKSHELPFHRQPSKTYLQCLVKGAQETGVPADYVNWLSSIKHNNLTNEHLESILDLAGVELQT